MRLHSGPAEGLLSHRKQSRITKLWLPIRRVRSWPAAGFVGWGLAASAGPPQTAPGTVAPRSLPLAATPKSRAGKPSQVVASHPRTRFPESSSHAALLSSTGSVPRTRCPPPFPLPDTEASGEPASGRRERGGGEGKRGKEARALWLRKLQRTSGARGGEHNRLGKGGRASERGCQVQGRPPRHEPSRCLVPRHECPAG